VWPFNERHPVEALQIFHASQDARIHIHDAIGIGEIPWQPDKGSIDLARPETKIAAFNRPFLGPAGVFHNPSPRSTSSIPGRTRDQPSTSIDRSRARPIASSLHCASSAVGRLNVKPNAVAETPLRIFTFFS
jgi:hypothetical protein